MAISTKTWHQRVIFGTLTWIAGGCLLRSFLVNECEGGMMADIQIGSASEVAPGQGKTVNVEGKSIALFNVGGNFHAIDNVCTHRGGSLGDGTLEGTVVTCPLHGAQFDVTTGEVKAPPAPGNVKTYPVKVDGEKLVVDL